jgi:hypothetical protein
MIRHLGIRREPHRTHAQMPRQPLTGLQRTLVSLEAGVRVPEEAWGAGWVGDRLKGMERPEAGPRPGQ